MHYKENRQLALVKDFKLHQLTTKRNKKMHKGAKFLLFCFLQLCLETKSSLGSSSDGGKKITAAFLNADKSPGRNLLI